MQKKQKGFTLIELMIVVAIIGILAAVAIPKFAQMLEKSREGATKGNIGAIKSAISIYSGDWQGVWPTFIEGSTANGVVGGTVAGDKWFANGTKGAYLDNVPAVKVTAKNNYNTVQNSVVGNAVAAVAGSITGTATLVTTGWAYESATGNVFVNNSQFDSFGLSYTLYGYQ